MPRRVRGLDGCRDGWVVVALDDGRVDDVEMVDHLDDAVDGTVEAIGVDIPIGLTDHPVREADVAARRLLGRRASSVFSAPLRHIVDAYRDGEVTTHAEASARTRERIGKGMSVQAWGLVPKVAEADAAVADGVALLEVHPEVAFLHLAGTPVPRKTSWAGVQVRRRLLAGVGIELPDDFGRADRVGPDDVLDAAVVAWVADGIVVDDGSTITLPERPSEQDRGRPIAIVSRSPSARTSIRRPGRP